MKTTRGWYNVMGDTIRIDESGRKLYKIWADGVIWINDSKTGEHELYINRIGHLFRYNKKKKEWKNGRKTPKNRV